MTINYRNNLKATTIKMEKPNYWMFYRSFKTYLNIKFRRILSIMNEVRLNQYQERYVAYEFKFLKKVIIRNQLLIININANIYYKFAWMIWIENLMIISKQKNKKFKPKSRDINSKNIMLLPSKNIFTIFDKAKVYIQQTRRNFRNFFNLDGRVKLVDFGIPTKLIKSLNRKGEDINESLQL